MGHSTFAHSSIEYVRPGRRLGVVFEVGLVVLIAFGSSVASSMISVLGGHRLSRALWIVLPVALGTLFLGYVLRRTRPQLTVDGAAEDLTPEDVRSRAFGLRRIGILLAVLVPALPLAVFPALGWLAYASRSAVLATNIVQVMRMMSDAFCLLVLSYVLTGTGRNFSRLGLYWSTPQASMALPIFLAGTLLCEFEWPTISWFGNTFVQSGWQPPDVGAMLFGSGVAIAAVPAELLNGFFEELIVRAYLMTEIIRLTRNAWVAVVVSVAVQTAYHFYQGVPLALSYIVLFALFALFYAKTRWVLPIALAHSLFDVDAVWHYGVYKLLPF